MQNKKHKNNNIKPSNKISPTKSELQTKTINIGGMHCRACEISVEQELLKIKNVKKADVSVSSKNAQIYFEGQLPEEEIYTAVTSCGYTVENNKQKSEWISTDKSDYDGLLEGVLLFLVLAIIAKTYGIFNVNLNASKDLSNLYAVLLIGVTAGLSTCMALVGGLVLGVAAKFAEQNPQATSFQKFKPHLFFNLGRIISFFLLGGLIGYFGSFFQMNTQYIGTLTIIVSLVMLTLGLQTLKIFPILDKAKLTLPKSLYKIMGIDKQKENGYSNKGAFYLGGLTFFLPCGFTQAMQIFAIASGSAKVGAITMGLFAIGTTFGLLSIGGITSVVKGSFTKVFFKFVALIVIFMALFNLSNGFNLLGIEISLPKNQIINTKDTNVSNVKGVQIVRMTQKADGYYPNKFTIKKGTPVKWIVTSETPNSCASSLIASQLGIRKILSTGENVFEFTPDKTGTIKFSCSMGMYRGSFEVID